MNKSENNTNITYYQKARFFRKKDTNEYAYCVEPFSFFYEKETYEETTHPYNLSQEQIDRISKIAYYGYGYKNHTDLKWYAITQMMIWKTSNENGKYYFITKGTANPNEDPEISEDDIYGKVVYHTVLFSFVGRLMTNIVIYLRF